LESFGRWIWKARLDSVLGEKRRGTLGGSYRWRLRVFGGDRRGFYRELAKRKANFLKFVDGDGVLIKFVGCC
jgi:hypothetical protein